MGYLFSFIIPTYVEGSPKAGVLYAYDKKRGCLIFQSVHIEGDRRALKKQSIKVPAKIAGPFLNWLNEEGDSIYEDLSSYAPLEGKKFSKGLFRYKDRMARLPDYLQNFGEWDIYRRYRYYPDKGRVRLYKDIRHIYEFCFGLTSYPKDIPLDGYPLDRIGPLEFDDFDLPMM